MGGWIDGWMDAILPTNSFLLGLCGCRRITETETIIWQKNKSEIQFNDSIAAKILVHIASAGAKH